MHFRTGLILATTCCQAYKFLDAGGGERAREERTRHSLAAAEGGRELLEASPGIPGDGGIDPGAAGFANMPEASPARITVRADDVTPLLKASEESMASMLDTWNSTAFKTMGSLVEEVNKSIFGLVTVGSSQQGTEDTHDMQGKWVSDFAAKLKITFLTAAQSREHEVFNKANESGKSYLARLGEVAEAVTNNFDLAASKVANLNGEASAFLQAAVTLRATASHEEASKHNEGHSGIRDWFNNLFGGGEDAYARAKSAIRAANESAIQVRKLAQDINESSYGMLGETVAVEVRGCIAELNTSIFIALKSKPAGILDDDLASKVNATFDPVRKFAQPALKDLETAMEAVSKTTSDVMVNAEQMFAITAAMQDEVDTLKEHAKAVKASEGGGGGGCGEGGSGYC